MATNTHIPFKSTYGQTFSRGRASDSHKVATANVAGKQRSSNLWSAKLDLSVLRTDNLWSHTAHLSKSKTIIIIQLTLFFFSFGKTIYAANYSNKAWRCTNFPYYDKRYKAIKTISFAAGLCSLKCSSVMKDMMIAKFKQTISSPATTPYSSLQGRSRQQWLGWCGPSPAAREGLTLENSQIVTFYSYRMFTQ